MSDATTEKKRTRNKRAYLVQVALPDGAWSDSVYSGENEQDALKKAREAKIKGKIRVVAVCGIYNLAEKVETKIGVSRVE